MAQEGGEEKKPFTGDVDIDPDFEPQKRPRSCTWPLPKPECSTGKPEPNEADIIPEEEDDEGGPDRCVDNTNTHTVEQTSDTRSKQSHNSGPTLNTTCNDKDSDGSPSPSSSQALTAAAAFTTAAQDGSSESSSSLSKWTGSPTSRSSDELDAWTDFRSRTNSNASTISGRLSPILANLEVDEVADDDSPLSPMLYSSPSSMSPSTGLTELPRLADLAGTMNLNDGLSDNLMNDLLDNISLTASQSPGQDDNSASEQGSPVFTFSCSGSSLGVPNSMFSPLSVTSLRQSPMQTIQENKQATFTCGSHFGKQSLQDMLSSEPHNHSDVLLTHSDPLMSQASASISSQSSRRSGQAGPAGQVGLKKVSLSGWRINGVIGSTSESDFQSLIKQHLQTASSTVSIQEHIYAAQLI
ncbi:Forkhead box protein O3 [Bagarius yarrelli]|uniref:Forkhead box protein O3 n=1 Tax=Bagarius yarrelli TaxID=175774 RepID=A0A556U941_BAGYA|nr:Forkhead box protein O3 [Bagarius yarrelli]